jgi:hypothetical protein
MPKALSMFSLLCVACAAAFGFQTQTPPDPGRRADIYAIYSQLIKAERLTNDRNYLIQETTLSASTGFGNLWRPERAQGLDGASGVPAPQPPRGQCPVQPPADGAPIYQEILADYAARKDMSATLTKEFTLDKPYDLVSLAEAEKFLKDALAASPQVGPAVPNSNPLAQNASRIVRLGDVYFNKQGSHAVTYLSVLTTTMDGTGGWRVFRKVSPGNWSLDSSWQTCGWGSGR